VSHGLYWRRTLGAPGYRLIDIRSVIEIGSRSFAIAINLQLEAWPIAELQKPIAIAIAIPIPIPTNLGPATWDLQPANVNQRSYFYPKGKRESRSLIPFLAAIIAKCATKKQYFSNIATECCCLLVTVDVLLGSISIGLNVFSSLMELQRMSWPVPSGMSVEAKS
jgi:hypothetical protein